MYRRALQETNGVWFQYFGAVIPNYSMKTLTYGNHCRIRHFILKFPILEYRFFEKLEIYQPQNPSAPLTCCSHFVETCFHHALRKIVSFRQSGVELKTSIPLLGDSLRHINQGKVQCRSNSEYHITDTRTYGKVEKI